MPRWETERNGNPPFHVTQIPIFLDASNIVPHNSHQTEWNLFICLSLLVETSQRTKWTPYLNAANLSGIYRWSWDPSRSIFTVKMVNVLSQVLPLWDLLWLTFQDTLVWIFSRWNTTERKIFFSLVSLFIYLFLPRLLFHTRSGHSITSLPG